MDTTNLRPLLRRNEITGERDIGFLNLEKGTFEVEKKIKSNFEIDEFMEKHDLCFIPISKINP